jgi:tetratricopeptide (TPR) repeat protein
MKRAPLLPAGAGLLALLLCPAPLFAEPAKPPAPSPAAVEEGRTHFTRGVELFREGNYRVALIEFQRAYEIAPSYRILYNLGHTHRELQDYAEALASFEKYLADGGAEIDAERRASVEAMIEKLRSRVANLEITINVSGAEILVDDVVVGAAPLSAPVRVSAGRRKVYASMGSRTSAARYVDVAGGDVAKVVLSFTDEPARPAPARPEPSAPPPPVAPQRRGSGVWIGFAATGALASVAVGMGVLALGAKGDFDQTLNNAVTATEIERARSKTRTFALAADVLGASAIVAGGVTLGVALSGNRSGAKKRAVTSVQLSIGPQGVVALGQF